MGGFGSWVLEGSRMTPSQIREARAQIGALWGLARPLRAAELGRVLRLKGRNPGATVLNWEAGRDEVSGPVSVAIEMMLAGAIPPTLDRAYLSAGDVESLK